MVKRTTTTDQSSPAPASKQATQNEINTVVLNGRLTANPELRSTVGGVMS